MINNTWELKKEMPMPLNIKTTKNDNGTLILSCRGEIDSDTYGVLEKELTGAITQSAKGVVLEMSDLEYISSIGFGVIVRAKQALEAKGLTLAISGLQPNVKRIFDAVKLIPESLFATLVEADSYLDQYIAFISGRKDRA